MNELESYGRHQNLQIIGIPLAPTGTKKTSEQDIQKVKEVIAGLNVENTNVDQAFDRAHRVGKKMTNAMQYQLEYQLEYQQYQLVMVRFVLWRARTAVDR